MGSVVLSRFLLKMEREIGRERMPNLSLCIFFVHAYMNCSYWYLPISNSLNIYDYYSAKLISTKLKYLSNDLDLGCLVLF